MKKVFFSAAISSISRMIDQYLLIIKYIKKFGASISLNWVDYWVKLSKHQDIEKLSKDEIDQLTEYNFFNVHAEGIKGSDFLIVEASEPSLGVGYQVFQAISLRIPILILYSDTVEDLSQMRATIDLNSKYITLKKYNKKNLGNIINGFINKRGDGVKKFNFLISHEVDDYLKWLQKLEPDKSKSEILRAKIEDIIIAADEKYLKSKHK